LKEAFVRRLLVGRRGFCALVVVLTVAGSVAAGLSTAGNAATRSRQATNLRLTVGNLVELTGVAAFLGPPFVQAGNVATTTLNRAAARSGVPMRVATTVADTQGDPQAALLAARSAVDKGATCLQGAASTPESLSIANALTVQRKIVLFPQASSTAISAINDDDTVFRTVPDTPKEAIAAANAVQTLLGGARGKTFAVAAFNQPYGTDLARFFSQVWTARGGKIQGPIFFDTRATSLDSEAAAIVKGNPDGYWIIGDPAVFGRLIQALLRTGNYVPSKLMVPSLLAFPTVPDNIPKAAMEGAHAETPTVLTTTPSYKYFDRLWKAAGKAEHNPSDVAIVDAYAVCALAAAAARSSNAASIQANIRKVSGPPGKRYNILSLGAALKAAWSGRDINYEGLSSDLNFNAAGDPGRTLFRIVSYKDGVQVPGPLTTARR
jgi:branched-chain amino acid transport system substrate-binding protein